MGNWILEILLPSHFPPPSPRATDIDFALGFTEHAVDLSNIKKISSIFLNRHFCDWNYEPKKYIEFFKHFCRNPHLREKQRSREGRADSLYCIARYNCGCIIIIILFPVYHIKNAEIGNSKSSHFLKARRLLRNLVMSPSGRNFIREWTFFIAIHDTSPSRIS